jgi:integrase/recombinase XerC
VDEAGVGPPEASEEGPDGDEPALPEPMAAVLAEYERHLVSERDLTPHTVRAYAADIAGMLEHAARLGHTDLSTLDVRSLRSWLANQQTRGLARTTMARRATAVRVFTAWAQRTGRTETDPGALLGSPKAHRTLPAALRRDEARELLEAAATRADDGSAAGLRDVAILELLYATGIRVGELCGLDVDDVDRERRVVRVFGKGRKERTVPYGQPADRALAVWLGGPDSAAVHGPAPRCSWECGGRIDQRAVRRWCTPASPTSPARPTSVRTAFGTPPPRTCSRAGRTCARSRSCSGTPRWRPPRSTPTSPLTA